MIINHLRLARRSVPNTPVVPPAEPNHSKDSHFLNGPSRILRFMPHVEKHLPGAFCWIELATTDQTAAKTFYTTLFGWSFEDSPMGPNDFYTMFRLGGRNTAAAYTLREDEAAMNIPSHWNLYVSVESADAASKRASDLGGQILVKAFDVATHGRMAVLQDPTGAVFSIWEPRDHPGLGMQGESGSFCWADLNTSDQPAAAKFYAGLFGWTLSPGESGYLHIKNGEAFIGGIPSASQVDPHAPPHWLIYLQVDNCDAATERAKELGANVFMAPTTVANVGRWSVLADPQGAVFSLFQAS
jgi:predicted enzyme related to lactoylglutathione lyase